MNTTRSSTFIGLLRLLVRRLMTDKTQVRFAEKCIRGVIATPIYNTMVALLGARLKISGPLHVESVTNDGDHFMCALPDSVPLYIYTFGVWEPDLTEFIRSRLRPGDVFVDVGANIGYDTLLGARAVGESGGAVSIEASPTVFERLQETLRLNGVPPQVRIINCAVSDKVGVLSLFAGPPTNVGATTTVPGQGMPQVAEVPARPLGDLLTPDELSRARLVKIDVEGGEIAVLTGMLDCVDRMPQDAEIAVELSPQMWEDPDATPANVLQPWVERGFNVYQTTNSYQPARYLWPKSVDRPARVHHPMQLTRRVERLEVVLSRQDTDVL
jgi:FkbM family methyltransferase